MSKFIVADLPETRVRSPRWRSQSDLMMPQSYGRSCWPQRKIVRESWPEVREAIPGSSADPQRPTRIAHLGATSDGSLPSLDGLFRALTTRNPGREIEVFHVDLPGTDFRPLFRQVSAGGDLDGRQCASRVFHRVLGASFLNPLFPRQSVDMTVCHMAAHWLSHVCSSDASERAEVARADWFRFWQARVEEMAVGGTVWLTMLGREVGTSSSAHLPVQLLKAAAHEAARQGWVSSSAAAALEVPVYRRTLDEALSPFQESPLSECFHVESAAYRESACPLVSRWCKHRDDARFAREVARFIRGFSESVVTRQLFGDRPRVEQRPAVARFFALVEQQVRELNRPLGLFRRGVITLVARRSGLAVPDSL